MRTKSEERRQHILAIAAEVFLQVGYEKASMAEIAQRVGGSKATLYSYFPSKEELFVAVMDLSAERLMGTVFDLLLRPGPPEEVLREMGRQYIKALLAPELVAIGRMAIAEGDRSVVGQLIFEKGVMRGWSLVRDFIQKILDERQRSDVDPMIAAWHLKALLEAELREPRMLGATRKLPPDAAVREVAARAVTVWLRGYGLEDAPRPRRPARRAGT
ncbi:TetR/AcrR family transcriptional regulator [Ideonella oryzae]|uniref:TetR/AcrR family transcriptional regulator n=1 Tax=Ideonella oryzae TaxID=2937441 RepID=A0ABT1BQJ1_9BURK|nr:TetR/AcrR family transcriptional regulator [Ideonella oryzae]MCO5978490.1 TetR/AcrR family transcriptional regulator [Ideonella oryzae]